MSISSCQACGAEVPEGARFCPKCGKEMSPPRPSRPKRRRQILWGTAALVVVTVVVVVAFVRFGPSDFKLFGWKGGRRQTISATENAALWAKAHVALVGFLGEGLKSFGRDEDQPVTEEELAPLSGFYYDFSRAVKAIADVTPPPEQAIMHRALLPIYQEMTACMVHIWDAQISNDPSAADLEWYELALLLDEAGGTTEMLTLETTP